MKDVYPVVLLLMMKLSHEKAKQIAHRIHVENSAVSSAWICKFKDHHGLVYTKLAEERFATDADTGDLWLESLRMLLEAYEK